MPTTPLLSELFDAMTRHWWVPVLRGVVAIVFGALALTNPGIALGTLVLWFGAYVLVDGVFSLIATVSSWSSRENRWLLLMEAIVSIWAGIVTFRQPELTTVVLLMLIAGWALASGVLRIIAAVRLRHVMEGEFWLGLSGALSILFSCLLIASPVAGALGLIYTIGAFAIASGVTLVILGLKIRGWRATHQLSGRAASA